MASYHPEHLCLCFRNYACLTKRALKAIYASAYGVVLHKYCRLGVTPTWPPRQWVDWLNRTLKYFFSFFGNEIIG